MIHSSDTLGERQSGRASVGVALALARAACGQAEERTVPRPAANKSAPPPSAPWVWVVNRDTNDVVAYHAHTGEVAAQIPVEQSANSVTSPRGSAKVYVSNEAANTISVIAKGTVKATLALVTPESQPHHLSASPDGKFVDVAEFGSNRVAVLDT
jgi:DNA-binding beta-propeller fold protein YncE